MLSKKLKFSIVTSILVISNLSQAAPPVPYIDKEYNDVVIEDTKDTKVSLACSIEKTVINYFGNRPICVQNLSCSRNERSNVAIVEPSQIKTSIFCPISSASAGCKSKTWQACMIDTTFPDGLVEKCASESPGPTKSGCPNFDSQGSSQKTEAGAR